MTLRTLCVLEHLTRWRLEQGFNRIFPKLGIAGNQFEILQPCNREFFTRIYFFVNPYLRDLHLSFTISAVRPGISSRGGLLISRGSFIRCVLRPVGWPQANLLWQSSMLQSSTK